MLRSDSIRCVSTLVLAALIAVAISSSASFDAHGVPARVSENDLEAIRRASLDYGEGWYEADAERMVRAVHPELAKRMIYTDTRSGRSRLHQQSAMTLVENTRRGGGSDSALANEESEVEILDVYRNAAVAKVTGPEWVDYLQLGKWNGEWKIVNVLWELHPEPTTTPGSS